MLIVWWKLPGSPPMHFADNVPAFHFQLPQEDETRGTTRNDGQLSKPSVIPP